MHSSIYNDVDRFTNERLSTTIGTIGLPGKKLDHGLNVH